MVINHRKIGRPQIWGPRWITAVSAAPLDSLPWWNFPHKPHSWRTVKFGGSTLDVAADNEIKWING